MTSTVVTVGAVEASSHRERIRDVYADAFGPIDDPDAWASDLFDRHRTRPGYRLCVAIDDDVVVGFAWVYTGLSGQLYADLMTDALGDQAADWTPGHFEFVELAVSTSARGFGLGRRLHDALLAGLPTVVRFFSRMTRSLLPAGCTAPGGGSGSPSSVRARS